jgi:murein DD-endopeptidase MepM/ murein hydrolase activator NlpD
MSQARQALQVAKWLASPAGMAAGAALGGTAVFLAGLAAQAPGIMGIGGAIAGGGFGALGGLIGSFIFPGVGTLAGMAIGTGIGSIVGGVGGYTYGQSLFNGQAAQTAKAFSNVGRAGLSQAPKVAADIASKAATSSKGILPSSQAVGKLASAGVKGLSGAINAISSSSMSVPVGPILGSTLGGTALIAFVINTGFMSTFLVPGSVSSCSQSDDGVEVCKSASVMNAPDPEDVTYTIDIKAPKDKAMTIVEISDVETVHASKEGQTPPTVTLPQEATDQFNAKKNTTVNPGSSVQITYTIPYGQDKNFDDTQILNTVSVEYKLDGKSATAQATAQVIFGEVKYGGCWPTTGTISQGPFTPTSSTTTHHYVDAIDIFANSEGGPNAPIFSPFAGSIQFFCLKTDGGCVNSFNPPIYGNMGLLTATDGKKILFGHMSSFANNPSTGTAFLAGNTYTLKDKGTQIGFMGKSGSGLPGSGGRIVSFSEHLHYELFSNTNSPPSEIQSILPEQLQTDSSVRGVPGTQKVRYDTCGSTSTQPPGTGKEEAVVECFHFIDDSKTWSKDELNLYTTQMQAMMSLPGVKQALCGDNVAINILRQDIDPSSTTEGCNYDGTGQAGAEWTGPYELNVCDKLFDPSQSGTFGVYTMWHEPGHAYQHKHSNWTSFTDFGASGYLPTYPLGKTRSEDFAESFGFCLYNKKYHPSFMTTGPASFRGVSVPLSTYKPHCEGIDHIIDPASGLPLM